jgi:conjugative transfer region lipoprotein (TIGR03751 family)
MHKVFRTFTLILISAAFVSGCASSKSRVFGKDMPSMKAIHDNKFQRTEAEQLPNPQRTMQATAPAIDSDFQWLPNPTLTMYVFPHLTGAGYPVPGYSTFFKLYTQDHIAAPGEHKGWE